MDAVRDTPRQRGEIHVSPPTEGTLLVHLSGSWTLQSDRPLVAELQQQIDAAAHVQRLTFETASLTGWDSGLVTFLRNVEELCRLRQIAIDRGTLPDGIRRLLDLAAAVPERQEARRGEARDPILARIGKWGISGVEAASDMLRFIGEAFLALLQLLRGRASFRGSDLAILLQECGAQALPIVTLISFLVGAILAFIGAVQLQQFGAQIYVANLVGLAMALGDDDRHHHVGSYRRGFRGAARDYAGEPGNRCVDHFRHLPHGIPRAPAHASPGVDGAAVDGVCRPHGYAGWRVHRRHHARDIA